MRHSKRKNISEQDIECNIKKYNSLDNLLKSALLEYTKDFSIEEKTLKENVPYYFECFSIYSILSKILGERPTIDTLEKINTDEAQGIDAIVFIVDNQVILDINDLEKDNVDKIKAIFIEVTLEKSESNQKISKFLTKSKDFLNKEKIKNLDDRFLTLYQNFKNKITNIDISFYFVNGYSEYNFNHNDINNEKETRLNDIKNSGFTLNFDFIGDQKIIKIWNKINLYNKITFTIDESMPLYVNGYDKIEKSIMAIVSLKEYLQVVDNESKNKLNYHNLRNYLSSNINKEIKEKLEEQDDRLFLFLNNGVTIVCETLEVDSIYPKIIKMENYGIVNGWQTSNILLEMKDKLDKNILKIVVKIVETKDKSTRTQISTATNKQNPTENIDVNDIYMKLEEYFKAEGIVFYERLKEGYKDITPIYRVISTRVLAQLYYSIKLGLPHIPKSKGGKTIENKIREGEIFNQKDKIEDYYVYALMYYCLYYLYYENIFKLNSYTGEYHFLLALYKVEEKNIGNLVKTVALQIKEQKNIQTTEEGIGFIELCKKMKSFLNEKCQNLSNKKGFYSKSKTAEMLNALKEFHNYEQNES